MDTLTSWAIFIAIVGAGYWYYTQNTGGKHRGRTLQRTATTNTKSADTNWMEAESKPKAAAKQSKAKAQAPRKSVKKAVQDVGSKVEATFSGASSTGGADADDDMSPVASPSLGATSAFQAPSGRDVSDMLEPKAATPGVMSIKASEKPARQNKAQAQKSEAPQETKKQRQNRKKVEEAKAQREADEKERQILLEKQRRTAREARGEPAKNGLQQAQSPSTNAWTTVSSRGAVAAPVAPVQNGGLLDTFEPEPASSAAPKATKTNGAAPVSNGAQYNNLPSEEEQIRIAMEDSAWTTVAKPKKTRKTKAVEEEGSDSGLPQEAAPVSAPVKKAPVKQPENVRQTSRYDLLAEPTNQGHELDSDWPVV